MKYCSDYLTSMCKNAALCVKRKSCHASYKVRMTNIFISLRKHQHFKEFSQLLDQVSQQIKTVTTVTSEFN